MFHIKMRQRTIKAIVLVGLSTCFAGCASMDGCSDEDVVSTVLGRVQWAAKESFVDPFTWVPLAGAAFFAIDDFDEKTVDWATDHHPVFSSREDADKASDDLAEILDLTSWYTAALAPRSTQVSSEQVLRDIGQSIGIIALTGKFGYYNLSTSKKYPLILATIGANYFYTAAEPKPDKTRLMAIQWLGHEGNYQLTVRLKDATNRVRPNEQNDLSFPSGHTSAAFSSAQLASRNLEHYDFREGVPFLARASLFTMASGTAWARVEANKHYPSDVLFGAALGNFVARFANNLLIGQKNENVAIAVSPMNRRLSVECSFKF